MNSDDIQTERPKPIGVDPLKLDEVEPKEHQPLLAHLEQRRAYFQGKADELTSVIQEIKARDQKNTE